MTLQRATLWRLGCKLHVSYPRRSGLVGMKSNHLRSIYFKAPCVQQPNDLLSNSTILEGDLRLQSTKSMTCLWETCLIRLLFLIGCLYLNGMWFGVAPRTNTITHMVQRDWINAYSTYDYYSRLNKICECYLVGFSCSPIFVN